MVVHFYQGSQFNLIVRDSSVSDVLLLNFAVQSNTQNPTLILLGTSDATSFNAWRKNQHSRE